ncbi:heavy metal-binding domain-containing protein [Mucilaginibacter sp. CSA2-8R]|uniref:heavy metal-binding domain-containing protein n=1 Tax=Mucilaginibacter sp. CSA2-8R TaxID=3141542 RepID=UPI00315C72F6
MKKLSIFCLIIGFAACKPAPVSTTQTPSHSGQTQTVYTCSMHPEVHASKPGVCPKCGMQLTKK